MHTKTNIRNGLPLQSKMFRELQDTRPGLGWDRMLGGEVVYGLPMAGVSPG